MSQAQRLNKGHFGQWISPTSASLSRPRRGMRRVRDGRFRHTPETRDSGHAQTLLKARSCAAPPHRSRPFRHLFIGKKRIDCDRDKPLYPHPKTHQAKPGIGRHWRGAWAAIGGPGSTAYPLGSDSATQRHGDAHQTKRVQGAARSQWTERRKRTLWVIYIMETFWKRMARVTGLEPATSGVTGRHSNRLSYTRAFSDCVVPDRAFQHLHEMARVTGLEPATSGVTGRHSNRLSYTRIHFKQSGCFRVRVKAACRFDERLTTGFAFECQAGLETKR